MYTLWLGKTKDGINRLNSVRPMRPKTLLAIDAAIQRINNINESLDLQIYSIVVNSDNCRGIYNAIQHRQYGFFLKLRKALDKESGQ